MTPFLGEIRAFAGAFVPDKWLQCDGSLQPITQYKELYGLIGTTYGGDGRTTFGLPDLRGRLIIQNGQLSGGPGYSLGASGGIESVTITTATMPTHNHAFTVGTIGGINTIADDNYLAGPRDINDTAVEVRTYLPYDPNDSTVKKVKLNLDALTTQGGSLAHENRQPYLCVTYIIAAKGLYPSSE